MGDPAHLVSFLFHSQFFPCAVGDPPERFLFSGEIQEKNGQRESALEYYRKALEFGKKVTYKFDYSAAEQAVKRLSK